MIAFPSNNAEQSFRDSSAKIHGSNSTSRTCCKCGAKKPQRELLRKNFLNTRIAPTKWVCKGGCDVC